MKKCILLMLIALPWILGYGYTKVKPRYHQRCESHMSVAYVMNNGDREYSRGIYLLDTSLSGSGHGVYAGEIVKETASNGQKNTIQVHISFSYSFAKQENGVVEGHIKNVSKELGNQATDEELARYLSPVLRPGENHRTRQLLLEGVRPAWGTTLYPGGLCSG